MGTSIVEKVLGNNTFYTNEYLKQSITFIKSIIVKSKAEAVSYNEYVRHKYPTHAIEEDPREWRYYRHLSGQLHALDKPVVAISSDNGSEILLTKSTMFIHRKTKTELLKFEQTYDQLVAKYPEQELYIKAVICDTDLSSVDDFYALPDFSIAYHNKALIEENEHDLVLELQTRIDNYKSIWLIQYYSTGYSLFLASQYHILYNFLLTSLLAIRLENVRTTRAHSYHIRLYLASHHKLDDHMLFLTKKQQLFLYRNMLYLDNHSGHNQTFRTLIDVLFTDRNISVVNYVYNQKNSLSGDSYVNYHYDRVLLNSKKLVHATANVEFSQLAEKERLLAPGNQAVYNYEYEDIDRTNRKSLLSQLLTKDLETILIDETDSVRYKLIDTIVDYWAYLLKTGLVSFLVDVTDPVTNVTKLLNTKDLFKLFVVGLHQQNGITLTEFPEYRIKRVFNPIKPTDEQLGSFFYDLRNSHREYIKDVKQAIPLYGNLSTSYQFAEFVSGIYRLNIGLWHMLTNYSDIDTNGQMEMMVHNLHINDLYTFNDETVDAFFRRTGVQDIRNYDTPTLIGYVFSILDNVFDQKLSYLNRMKKLQAALTDVFFKFNSYTVQLINNYFSDSSYLVGVKDVRYGLKADTSYDLSETGSVIPALSLEHVSTTKNKETLETCIEYRFQVNVRSDVSIDSLVSLQVQPTTYNDLDISFSGVKVLDIFDIVRLEETAEIFFSTRPLDHHEHLIPSVGVDFHTDVTHEASSSTDPNKVVAFSVGVSIDSVPPPGQVLSDAHLDFLAMNMN